MVLEYRRLDSSISQVTAEIKRLEKVLREWQRQHPWIVDQEEHFGKTGTAFDFTADGIAKVKQRVALLEEQYSQMRKTVNVNVMDMIDRYWRVTLRLISSVESKETSLKQMLATVKKDKEKIEQTLVKLNDYKLEALEKTWIKVSQYGHHHQYLLCL